MREDFSFKKVGSAIGSGAKKGVGAVGSGAGTAVHAVGSGANTAVHSVGTGLKKGIGGVKDLGNVIKDKALLPFWNWLKRFYGWLVCCVCACCLCLCWFMGGGVIWKAFTSVTDGLSENTSKAAMMMV